MAHTVTRQRTESINKLISGRAISTNRPTFRPFAGESDFPLMVDIIRGSKEADQTEWTPTVEDVTRNYQHLVKSDPDRDVTFVEVNGQAVGYTRVWWTQEIDGTRLYQHFAHLLPEWRKDGLRRTMLHRNERRLREIASDHPAEHRKFLQAGASGESGA